MAPSVRSGIWWPALVVFGLTLAAYWPALRGALLWDDAGHVTTPALRSLGGLWRIWFELGATQQYYPLLHSAFWLEHRLWGDNVLGYHLVNVVLHATSAVLVAVIVRRLSLPGAWFAACLFALHPVHVESVAWITEQKNTLSTVFYLASAATYLAFDETRRRRAYGLASVLFVAALASKTSTATLPAALLVVFWWRRGRLDWRRDVTPLLPWLVAGVAAGVFTAWVEQEIIGAKGDAFSLSIIERVLVAGRVLWFYVFTLVWPVHLTFTYPRWNIDAGDWTAWIYPLAFLVLIAICWRLRGRHRGPLAGTLFFAGTLVPVLGFFNVFPFLFSYVADHFQYVASLGVIVPAAVGATVLAGRLPGRMAPVLGGALVLLLGYGTWRQSATYRDVETLYRTTIVRNPASWMAHTNLGVYLANIPGRLPEAIAEFQAALAIRPDYIDARRNLALALWRTPGRSTEAIAAYEATMRLDPNNASDHLSLARLLSDRPDRTRDALAHAEAAVGIDPASWEAHFTLANLLARDGREGAVAAYRTALRLNPDAAEVHLNFGNLLLRMPGSEADAVTEFETAVRLRPEYAEAHYNLGTLLMDLPGRMADAVTHLRDAVRLRPTSVEAHHNLALALSATPAGVAEAIAHLEEALRIDPAVAPSRQLLAELRAKSR